MCEIIGRKSFSDVKLHFYFLLVIILVLPYEIIIVNLFMQSNISILHLNINH